MSAIKQIDRPMRFAYADPPYLGCASYYKALRALLALRRKDAAEVAEQDEILTLYRRALGM